MAITKKNVRLLWVYNSRMEPGFGVKKHSHNYYHLICILDGKMRFTLDETEYILSKDDIVLVHKGTNHSLQNDYSEPVNYCEMKFTILSKSLSQTLLSSKEQVLQDTFARHLVSHVGDEYLHSRTLKDDSATAALETLIFHLTANTRTISENDQAVIDVTGYSALSQKVVNFLTDHYAENLTLDEISQNVGATKNYLCNAFKRNTGITIIDCLNTIRIRKAAELIVYSDFTLAQVAQMCGYVSVSHFNRIFTRYVGIPPGQCRRAYSYDILLQGDKVQRSADSFMYSVLAGKSISPNTINSFEQQRIQADDPTDLVDFIAE